MRNIRNLLTDFLDYIRDNYYENSDVWVNSETDKVESKSVMAKKFLDSVDLDDYEITPNA